VPDASTGDQQGQQPPPPPDKQIDQQISLGRVMDQLGSLFGGGWETTAGGGGTGGQFMFADIGELDAVIKQWETEYEAIVKDGQTIFQAAGLIEPPAQDGMSVGQADATRQSLIKLREHNEAMKGYAEGYIKKLKASRASMANTDQGNAAQLNTVDGS
jgi:hypothetical protein